MIFVGALYPEYSIHSIPVLTEPGRRDACLAAIARLQKEALAAGKGFAHSRLLDAHTRAGYPVRLDRAALAVDTEPKAPSKRKKAAD